MKATTLIIIAILLTACGTARTIVLEPVETTQKFTNAKLVAHNPTIEVPPVVIEKFESVIRKGLYEEGAFFEGEDLTIQYTFVSHDKGNQFARWFWGGIGNAGEGSVVVRVTYLNLAGNEITQTQVEGRIGSGFLGGSMNEAIIRAGEDIVKFTIQHFSVNGGEA